MKTAFLILAALTVMLAYIVAMLLAASTGNLLLFGCILVVGFGAVCPLMMSAADGVIKVNN